MRSERGNVSVIAMAGVALAIMLCVGVARVGSAAAQKAHADTVTDAAALAGADALALGRTPAAAADAARDAAAANGGILVTCVCATESAEVVVAIGRARSSAHAVVDLSRGPELEP
jgi:hypothetical protein